jgi:hypothetical protein
MCGYKIGSGGIVECLLACGVSTLILVKQSEVNLKISELDELGSKSIKNIERGDLDSLWRTLFIFLATKSRAESSVFMNEIYVEGWKF